MLTYKLPVCDQDCALIGLHVKADHIPLTGAIQELII